MFKFIKNAILLFLGSRVEANYRQGKNHSLLRTEFFNAKAETDKWNKDIVETVGMIRQNNVISPNLLCHLVFARIKVDLAGRKQDSIHLKLYKRSIRASIWMATLIDTFSRFYPEEFRGMQIKCEELASDYSVEQYSYKTFLYVVSKTMDPKAHEKRLEKWKAMNHTNQDASNV